MKPVTRMEMLFDAIAKCDPVDFKPENRMEAWLCKLSEPPSWNDLSDKPIQEVGGLTIASDGNAEGLDNIFGSFYKVSDLAPTLEDFANGCTVQTSFGEIYTYTQEYISDYSYDIFGCNVTNITVQGNFFVIFPEDASHPSGITVKKGTYFCDTDGFAHTLTIHGKNVLSRELLPKASAVADVTAAPTAENFNALLASLRAAGYLSE